MDHRLECKVKTIKLWEENIGVNLHELGLGNGFSHMTPKASATKDKNRLSWTPSTLKIFYTSKDTIKKVKRHQKNGRKFLQFIYLIWDVYLEYKRILKAQ